MLLETVCELHYGRVTTVKSFELLMNRIPEKETLLEIFQWRVKQSSDDVAFKFNDHEMTYEEYDLKANQVANGFIKSGCLPNSRIAVLAKNSVVYAEILFGSLKSRTALVGLNWRLAGAEVTFIVNDSKSEILFVGKEFYPLVDQIKHEFNHVKQIIGIDYKHGEWQSYDSWQNSFDDSEPGLDGSGDDDVIQLYTSGTTGLPKGVRLTNKNINRATPMVKETWGKDWHERSVNFILSPLFHIAGSNIVLMGVVFGCKNIVIPEPNPEKILHLIQTEKIETAFMVPALIQFILNHPDAAKTDFSSLRQIVYGASPISEDTLLRAIEVMGCEFWQVYGLTETSGIGTTLAPECHDPSSSKLRSCGKKYSGVDIKIVDQKGAEVFPGEVGEITIKSSVVMKGYWNRDEANKESIIDGWFYSGDAGYFDEDGFLFIYDRVKDMIISGGENIYPAEVENAIMHHPDVIDAAAVGVPDDKWGETVKGFVVLKKDSKAGESDIIAATKTLIASYKCPSSINIISEMPRNPSGKILRRELRAPFWLDGKRNVS